MKKLGIQRLPQLQEIARAISPRDSTSPPPTRTTALCPRSTRNRPLHTTSQLAATRNALPLAYDAYAEKRAAPMDRRFSWPRAIGNREHHTMLGLAAGLVMLAMKMWME